MVGQLMQQKMELLTELAALEERALVTEDIKEIYELLAAHDKVTQELEVVETSLRSANVEKELS